MTFPLADDALEAASRRFAIAYAAGVDAARDSDPRDAEAAGFPGALALWWLRGFDSVASPPTLPAATPPPPGADGGEIEAAYTAGRQTASFAEGAVNPYPEDRPDLRRWWQRGRLFSMTDGRLHHASRSRDEAMARLGEAEARLSQQRQLPLPMPPPSAAAQATERPPAIAIAVDTAVRLLAIGCFGPQAAGSSSALYRTEMHLFHRHSTFPRDRLIDDAIAAIGIRSGYAIPLVHASGAAKLVDRRYLEEAGRLPHRLRLMRRTPMPSLLRDFDSRALDAAAQTDDFVLQSWVTENGCRIEAYAEDM